MIFACSKYQVAYYNGPYTVINSGEDFALTLESV